MSITDRQTTRAADIDLSPVDLAAVAAGAIDSKQGARTSSSSTWVTFSVSSTCSSLPPGPRSDRSRTLVEEVDVQLERYSRSPLRVEGMDTGDWVLLDYGDLAVHIFQPEARDFYSLERLWGDAPRVTWAPVLPTGA